MIRALCIALALALPLRAEVYPAFHDVTGVADDDVLNIRAAPDAASPVIGALSSDATGVEVVAVQDGWAVVNSGEVSGFAALRFLTRSNAPDWNALQTPLTCLGTEPFWSLEIDPGAEAATMAASDHLDGVTTQIEQTWPAEPFAQAAALSLPEGMVVLYPAECSDGMSDQSYGIAADLFLSVPDQTRLSGCCRLRPP